MYDGSGDGPLRADVGVSGERVVAVGDLRGAEAPLAVDATGLAVTPGFINVLSHSEYTLLADGRGLSELVQGVTTEIFGESHSMGPLTAEKRAELKERLEADGVQAEGWSRLSEYLDLLERRGVAQNVGSLVGGATIRENCVGFEDRPATELEMAAMRRLLAEELEDGALGLGSALIYPPGSYATTAELVELCHVVAAYDGAYFSHVRCEGRNLLSAIEELVEITRRTGVRSEVYHLKASGPDNWPLMADAIGAIETARGNGLAVTADMYPYTSSSTGLSTVVPPHFYSGGKDAFLQRLEDPAAREDVLTEVRRSHRDWEERAINTTVIGLTSPELQPLVGQTLAQIARHLGMDAPAAALELLRIERSSVSAIFATMSEENVRFGLSQPWVAIGSDGAAMAPPERGSAKPVHPRGYGAFARFLGHYVRELGLVPFTEAVRRLTSLPASTLGLSQRGRVLPGYFADLVVLDPAAVADFATYADPHRLAVGVQWVIINGSVALERGQPTGRATGRALRRGAT